MLVSKHSPKTTILTQTQRDTTVFISGKTPFVSAIKRIDRILEKFDHLVAPVLHRPKFNNREYKKVKYIVIKGMGKSIQKVISLGLFYQTQKSYTVDIYTGTVPVVDTVTTEEVIETREGPEEQTKRQSRDASSVEVRIWLKLR